MDIRYSANPNDVKRYTTEELRREFLIEELFAVFIDVCSLAIVKTIVAFIKQNDACNLTSLVVDRLPLAQNLINLCIGNQCNSEKCNS